jgi:hypothetical protein
MSTLTNPERTGVLVAAQEFSATRKKRSASLTVSGRRVRLEFAALPATGNGPGRGHKPHLRFDRLVVRVLHDVQTSLRQAVPPGVAIVFTLTAPIRLASRTSAALEEAARRLLAESRGPDEVSRAIHGNRIRVRREKVGAGPASAVIGFVHNIETRPRELFDVTRALLTVLWAKAPPRASKRSGDRWLVILVSDSSHLEAYRSIYRQLDGRLGFSRVLMVSEDGGVEALA